MGGKRKKSNNGPIKKESKYKIPTRFDCPLCDAKASIVVKIVRKENYATVRCRTCGAGGTKRWRVLRLEKPVDVYFRFHEALIQQDQRDLQRVEMNREAQQARLSTGASDPIARTQYGASIDGPRSVAAAGDASWVGGGGSSSSGAGAVVPRGEAPVAADKAASASRQVRSLGELQRVLTMSATTSSSPSAAAPAVSSRAIDLGVDDFEGEARGAAEHYFAPRQEVHSGDDGDDEYDQLFQ